mmetsp:Transcript_18043/g.33877  ORF Transcript_18043/g.33877 Transcript_18043/m.33877 type:complete len:169 (+) Transcript_18043:49-555(+)
MPFDAAGADVPAEGQDGSPCQLAVAPLPEDGGDQAPLPADGRSDIEALSEEELRGLVLSCVEIIQTQTAEYEDRASNQTRRARALRNELKRLHDQLLAQDERKKILVDKLKTMKEEFKDIPARSSQGAEGITDESELAEFRELGTVGDRACRAGILSGSQRLQWRQKW